MLPKDIPLNSVADAVHVGHGRVATVRVAVLIELEVSRGFPSNWTLVRESTVLIVLQLVTRVASRGGDARLED